MLLTLLAPEYIMARAFVDFVTARSGEKRMQELAVADGVEWTRTHAFFANMGGFVVRFNALVEEEGKAEGPALNRQHSGQVSPLAERGQSPQTVTALQSRLERFVKEALEDVERYGEALEREYSSIGDIDSVVDHKNQCSVVAALHGAKVEDVNILIEDLVDNLIVLQGEMWTLNADQMLLARKIGIVKSLPSVSEDELEDQSKGDSLIKCLAVLHIVWLVAQLLQRHFIGIPSSPLEIAVLAFAVPSLIAYGLLWSKPQDVQTPRYVAADRYPTAEEILRIGAEGCYAIWSGKYIGGHRGSRTMFWSLTLRLKEKVRSKPS